MSIMRYEPWGLLNQLQRELERNGAEGSTATAEWAPAVDIKEEADKFVIHADIPGVKPEDIDARAAIGRIAVLVCSSDNDLVVIRSAIERIHSGPGLDHVIARAAGQGVVSRAAIEGIVSIFAG